MIGVDGADLLGWRDISIGIRMFWSRVSSRAWRVLILVIICGSKSDITCGEMRGVAAGGDRDANPCA